MPSLPRPASLHAAVLAALVVLVLAAMACAAIDLGRVALALFSAASVGGALWVTFGMPLIAREYRSPSTNPGAAPHAEPDAAPASDGGGAGERRGVR